MTTTDIAGTRRPRPPAGRDALSERAPLRGREQPCILLVVFSDLKAEFRPMLALAWPVVVAELGWMLMGIVDIIMVGRLSPEAIGAVGVGSALFVAVAVFGMGLLLGLDTFVSQAYGARSLVDCHRWLLHGVYLALVLTPPVMLAALGLVGTMHWWGLHAGVESLTAPYLATVAWSSLPLLLYAAFRRYLQAMNVVRPIMLVLLTANLVNVAVNWLLIFGNLGFPALGTAGAAWATVLSRVYMAVALAAIIVWHERRARTGLFATPLRVESARLWRLFALGLPAATHLTAEVGVFAAATALAGRLDPIALASHQIALNVAGASYMVPLGVASAGAVRVGQAMGRRDPAGVRRSGWTAIAIGLGFMACAALAFLLIPHAIIGLFTIDAAVIATGASLLLIAAVFQLFDGLQGVVTGVLRGLGDTRTAMVSNLAAHWLVGLPLGYVLCFVLGWGVQGLWMGLCISLIVVGLALVGVWVQRIRQVQRTFADGDAPMPFATHADIADARIVGSEP
jgi:multidrug resistance protein, MATE family